MEWIDRFQGRMFDLLHNVDTDRKMSIQDLQVVGENKQFGTAYRATPVKSMRLLLDQFRESATATTFVDLGCGKGSTLLAASRFPFQKIVGVEFADELSRIAKKNISNYRGIQACKNISVYPMDAAEFPFPDGPLLIYFFNPFHAPIMEMVLQHLMESIAAAPRPVTIVCDSLYYRDLIMKIFCPLRTDQVVGFSVYHQPDVSQWIPEHLRIANLRDLA